MEVNIKYRLHEIRKERRLTVEQLSEISGVSATRIYEIEKNNADPRLSTVVSLAISLRVTPNDLFTYNI